jgi:hypothetical protein
MARGPAVVAEPVANRSALIGRLPDGLLSGFAGAASDAVFEGRDEGFSVADLAGASSLADPVQAEWGRKADNDLCRNRSDALFTLALCGPGLALGPVVAGFDVDFQRHAEVHD